MRVGEMIEQLLDYDVDMDVYLWDGLMVHDVVEMWEVDGKLVVMG